MKTLISSVGMMVMVCGLALAQEPPVVAAQAGPDQVFIERGGAESVPLPLPPPGNIRYFRTGMDMGRQMGGAVEIRRGMEEWWKDPELAQKVGLSDAQVQQLDKISYDSQMKMIDLQATLEKEQLTLRHELQADHPNEDEVLGQVDKVSQARAAVMRAHVQTMLATRNVLTAEQWKKLQTSRKTFHRRFIVRQRSDDDGMPMMKGMAPKP
jgi:Spy/CpxP family protein refolding chaperone